MGWFWILVLAGAMALYTSRLNSPQDEGLTCLRALLLVPICSPGDRPAPAIYEWAVDCLRDELGAEVRLHVRPLLIPKEGFDPKRGQGDAVHLVNLVETMVTPECAVLGLTEYDLHSPLRRDLPYALGARKGWAGLISTYRMEDKRDPANTKERLRKMLVRYGAEIVCDAQRVSDPRSVLYQNLHRAEQLDLMDWP